MSKAECQNGIAPLRKVECPETRVESQTKPTDCLPPALQPSSRRRIPVAPLRGNLLPNSLSIPLRSLPPLRLCEKSSKVATECPQPVTRSGKRSRQSRVARDQGRQSKKTLQPSSRRLFPSRRCVKSSPELSQHSSAFSVPSASLREVLADYGAGFDCTGTGGCFQRMITS